MGNVGLRIFLGDSPLKLSGCVPNEHGLRLYDSACRVFAENKSDRGLREMLAKSGHVVWASMENIPAQPLPTRCRRSRPGLRPILPTPAGTE